MPALWLRVDTEHAESLKRPFRARRGSLLMWLYENDSRVRDAIDAGKAHFGTVDTWLLFKLTAGRSYLTDYTNASRTLLFNIGVPLWNSLFQ